MPASQLFYGDNLDVLRRHVADESVDLIYLDPPFNSNRAYNVLFRNQKGEASTAQIQAFDDTWSWSPEIEQQYAELVAGGRSPRLADAIEGMRRILGEIDLLAYLVMMAPRLVQLHRVLKPNGSIYLHCDHTASHYIKVLLDAVFGATAFQNSIVWKRTSAHGNASRKFASVQDTILYYAKGTRATWNQQFEPYSTDYVAQRFTHADPDGRRFRDSDMRNPGPRPNLRYTFNGYEPHPNGWAVSREEMERLDRENRLYYTSSKSGGTIRRKLYLDESPGVPFSDVWTDIPPINSQAQERLGYPTQKPIALLERIIASSSNPGDVVLDPFCGCGTSIDAAHALGRTWIGIDITYIAVDLIQKRLQARYGDEVKRTFSVNGIPRDAESAKALFGRSPIGFQQWAVSLVDGTPNEKTSGDRGVDGIIRFYANTKFDIGRDIVSVKGGGLNPSMLRDLIGTVDTQRAELGMMVTLEHPTGGIIDAAQHAGRYTCPLTGQSYPRIHVATVGDLLAGAKPPVPPALLPYLKAERAAAGTQARLMA